MNKETEIKKDKFGIPYEFGNREMRRNLLKRKGKKNPQLHASKEMVRAKLFALKGKS